MTSAGEDSVIGAHRDDSQVKSGKIALSDSDGVHALYTPRAILAHLAHLRGCRTSKLLIIHRLLRYSGYIEQKQKYIRGVFIFIMENPVGCLMQAEVWIGWPIHTRVWLQWVRRLKPSNNYFVSVNRSKSPVLKPSKPTGQQSS